MYYYNGEERDKAAQRIIDAYTEAAGYYAIIRPIIKAYAGKCYNRRFDNALHDTGKKIYVENKDKYLTVYAWIGREMLTLCSINKNDMQDGKRINATKMLENARERRECLLREAEGIRRAMENHDAMQVQIDSLKKVLEGITKDIPYRALDIYGLNVSIRR